MGKGAAGPFPIHSRRSPGARCSACRSWNQAVTPRTWGRRCGRDAWGRASSHPPTRSDARCARACSPQKFRPSLCGLLFQAIFMMQTAEHRSRIDAIPSSKHVPPDAGRNLGLRRFRNSRSQRRVRPSAIVVGHEFGADRLQMAFVERNQIVQALSTDGPNQSFAESIRGWSSGGRLQYPNTEPSQSRSRS